MSVPLPKNFATVQEALDFVAQHPTCDLVMSRRPEYPKKDIRFIVKFNRAQRVAWHHAADTRADKKETEE